MHALKFNIAFLASVPYAGYLLSRKRRQVARCVDSTPLVIMNCCCLLLGACVDWTPTVWGRNCVAQTSNMLNLVASFVVLVVVDALCPLCLLSSRGRSSWWRFRIFENCYQQTGKHSHLSVCVCVGAHLPRLLLPLFLADSKQHISWRLLHVACGFVSIRPAAAAAVPVYVLSSFSRLRRTCKVRFAVARSSLVLKKN